MLHFTGTAAAQLLPAGKNELTSAIKP